MSRWPYNTSQWQALRTAKLSEQPLCQACLRRDVVEPAYAVDHVIAIAAGGDPFPPLAELMSLCEPCHNSKTNAVDHPNASGFRRALKGFDVDGNPIDPEGWEAGTEGLTAPLSSALIHVPENTQRAPAARSGDSRAYSGKPGAPQGRETDATGPARYTNKDLVLQTIRNKEDDEWV